MRVSVLSATAPRDLAQTTMSHAAFYTTPAFSASTLLSRPFRTRQSLSTASLRSCFTIISRIIACRLTRLARYILAWPMATFCNCAKVFSKTVASEKLHRPSLSRYIFRPRVAFRVDRSAACYFSNLHSMMQPSCVFDVPHTSRYCSRELSAFTSGESEN